VLAIAQRKNDEFRDHDEKNEGMKSFVFGGRRRI